MQVRIAYPGVEGSFSHMAAIEAGNKMHHSCCFLGYESFPDAAQSVMVGECDFAILPVENSFAGAVLQTYALLEKLPLYIVGEHIKKISHCLLAPYGSTLEGIRKISSHPQAISQCDSFLQKMKNVQIIPSGNTAISAKEVARAGDRTCAAIASAEAAEKYGLHVLARNIQSSSTNFTRFLVLSRDKKPLCDEIPNKATVVFKVTNEVGSLVKVLESFARSSLNMTRIESRPIPDKPFVYFFTCDFFGPMDAQHLDFAMQDAARFSVDLRLLGAYKQAEFADSNL